VSKSVLTLTANPAIDRIILVDRLVFEDRAYILSTSDGAGGRGINAARVVTSFGAKATALTFSGGECGRDFEKYLEQDEFARKIVKIGENIRINLTITDRQGLSMKLNEVGPTVSERELAQLRKAVEKLLGGASWVMLCGSLPRGVDPRFYTDVIRSAGTRKVQTLLDTDGDPLVYGLEAGPDLVKPNQQEAERLLNTALITRSHSLEAVQKIKAMGAHRAVLSLGSRGAVAAAPEGVFEVVPPRVDALSPIGAGDALGAALVWALDTGKTFVEALRWGVAAGTASSVLPGSKLAALDDAKKLYSQVQVSAIPT